MSVTQTVDIPDSRRLVIDVPSEVPTGRTILTFTPAADDQNNENADDSWFERGEECPICAKRRDPATGELRFNAETEAGMQEVEDMISGKTSAKWYNSAEEMWEDLTKEDPDD